MSESDQPNRRPRWFQFDLRLLFVLIAVIGAVLAITVATRARKAERKLLETLAVGDSVHVLRAEGGSVTIHYGSALVRGSVGTITEIGEDFSGYGAARCFAPAEVGEIAEALAASDDDDVMVRFDPQRMAELQVYPFGWDEPDDREWLLKSLRSLRSFYGDAAANGRAIVTCLV